MISSVDDYLAKKNETKKESFKCKRRMIRIKHFFSFEHLFSLILFISFHLISILIIIMFVSIYHDSILFTRFSIVFLLEIIIIILSILNKKSFQSTMVFSSIFFFFFIAFTWWKFTISIHTEYILTFSHLFPKINEQIRFDWLNSFYFNEKSYIMNLRQNTYTWFLICQLIFFNLTIFWFCRFVIHHDYFVR